MALARGKGLKLPLVYNCGGYEKKETLLLLDRVVDIYMPDFKYTMQERAEKYSGVRDYPEKVRETLREMDRQVGGAQTDSAGREFKVNDVEGNPIEIAAVVVFRVVDLAKALFDVDDYEEFVEIQSETALRHVATRYPYDTFEDDGGYSLRGNAEEAAAELGTELQARLSVAG